MVYASGFDIVNFPLGGFYGTTKSKKIMGAEKIYTALEYASSVFSPGTVWTDLAMSTGSQDQFKEGIDRLIDSGIMPLILLQRDSEGSTYPNLVELADHMDQAIQRMAFLLNGCIPPAGF